jgi:hypothetical protein
LGSPRLVLGLLPVAPMFCFRLSCGLRLAFCVCLCHHCFVAADVGSGAAPSTSPALGPEDAGGGAGSEVKGRRSSTNVDVTAGKEAPPFVVATGGAGVVEGGGVAEPVSVRPRSRTGGGAPLARNPYGEIDSLEAIEALKRRHAEELQYVVAVFPQPRDPTHTHTPSPCQHPPRSDGDVDAVLVRTLLTACSLLGCVCVCVRLCCVRVCERFTDALRWVLRQELAKEKARGSVLASERSKTRRETMEAVYEKERVAVGGGAGACYTTVCWPCAHIWRCEHVPCDGLLAHTSTRPSWAPW